jgi:hypothetical protein
MHDILAYADTYTCLHHMFVFYDIDVIVGHFLQVIPALTYFHFYFINAFDFLCLLMSLIRFINQIIVAQFAIFVSDIHRVHPILLCNEWLWYCGNSFVPTNINMYYHG